jgi:hypothetical protein
MQRNSVAHCVKFYLEANGVIVGLWLVVRHSNDTYFIAVPLFNELSICELDNQI